MARMDSGGSSIPIYKPPKPKKPTVHGGGVGVTVKPKSTAGTTSTGTKGGAGGSGSDGGYSSYLASQKKQQSKAARRYIDQAKAMSGQIAALKNSLSVGFKAALDQRLANIGLVSGQQDALLMEGYQNRIKQLEGSAADNEKAEAGQSFANLSNRARERANAVTEAMNNGAGESDVLKAGMASLRSWSANQGDIQRSFFDTLRSVNSSLTDLNADTKTGRANIASQANADRDSVWSQYYQQRSETYTQLGNLYGQQGELYGMANEQKGSKATKRLRKQAVAGSDSMFMHASKANGRAYENPGVPAEIMGWQGHGEFTGNQPTGNTIEAAQANEPIATKPEGATLRKWTV